MGAACRLETQLCISVPVTPTVQQSYSRAVQKPSLFNITAEHALGSCVDNNMREVLEGLVKQSSKVGPDSCIL